MAKKQIFVASLPTTVRKSDSQHFYVKIGVFTLLKKLRFLIEKVKNKN